MQIYDSGLGYSILSGHNARRELGTMCRSVFGQSETYILADSNVGPLWLQEYTESLQSNGITVHPYVYDAGENHKNIETIMGFLKFMLGSGISRNDYVIGLGGGVTGDMSGFAASVCLRGIRYVQAPTTLLAAVDSSVGGKTGIDFNGYKNSVGSFHNPSLVVFDLDTLDTLPERELHNGAAEIIKYGVIADNDIFRTSSGGLDSSSLTEKIVSDCVRIKLRTVTDDPFDKGIRKLLNFGHTFGHAYEVLSDYAIPHGEAVAAGMVTAAEISERMGFCGTDTTDSIRKACLANSLPVSFDFGKEAVINTIRLDKKHTADTIDFVYVNNIGSCKIINTKITEIAEKYGYTD